MSTVARPRGPLPTRIYWVRRLALLAIALLIGVLIIRWIDGGDSGATPPEDEAPAAATESDGQTEPEKPDEKDNDKSRTARIRTVAETFERPREACDLTQVLVVPSVADPAYADEPVRLTLRISSVTSTPCSLDLDADHLLVSITDGDDTVWESTRCEDEIPVRELALQPNWSALVDVTWSGLYSGRRCTSGSTPAEPGIYSVQAAVLEGEPSEAEFELLERPEPPAEEDGDEAEEPTDDATEAQT
jgi:hypothetical protein